MASHSTHAAGEKAPHGPTEDDVDKAIEALREAPDASGGLGFAIRRRDPFALVRSDSSSSASSATTSPTSSPSPASSASESKGPEKPADRLVMSEEADESSGPAVMRADSGDEAPDLRSKLAELQAAYESPDGVLPPLLHSASSATDVQAPSSAMVPAAVAGRPPPAIRRPDVLRADSTADMGVMDLPRLDGDGMLTPLSAFVRDTRPRFSYRQFFHAELGRLRRLLDPVIRTPGMTLVQSSKEVAEWTTLRLERLFAALFDPAAAAALTDNDWMLPTEEMYERDPGAIDLEWSGAEYLVRLRRAAWLFARHRAHFRALPTAATGYYSPNAFPTPDDFRAWLDKTTKRTENSIKTLRDDAQTVAEKLWKEANEKRVRVLANAARSAFGSSTPASSAGGASGTTGATGPTTTSGPGAGVRVGGGSANPALTTPVADPAGGTAARGAAAEPGTGRARRAPRRGDDMFEEEEEIAWGARPGAAATAASATEATNGAGGDSAAPRSVPVVGDDPSKAREASCCVRMLCCFAGATKTVAVAAAGAVATGAKVVVVGAAVGVDAVVGKVSGAIQEAKGLGPVWTDLDTNPAIPAYDSDEDGDAPDTEALRDGGYALNGALNLDAKEVTLGTAGNSGGGSGGATPAAAAAAVTGANGPRPDRPSPRDLLPLLVRLLLEIRNPEAARPERRVRNAYVGGVAMDAVVDTTSPTTRPAIPDMMDAVDGAMGLARPALPSMAMHLVWEFCLRYYIAPIVRESAVLQALAQYLDGAVRQNAEELEPMLRAMLDHVRTLRNLVFQADVLVCKPEHAARDLSLVRFTLHYLVRLLRGLAAHLFDLFEIPANVRAVKPFLDLYSWVWRLFLAMTPEAAAEACRQAAQTAAAIRALTPDVPGSPLARVGARGSSTGSPERQESAPDSPATPRFELELATAVERGLRARWFREVRAIREREAAEERREQRREERRRSSVVARAPATGGAGADGAVGTGAGAGSTVLSPSSPSARGPHRTVQMTRMFQVEAEAAHALRVRVSADMPDRLAVRATGALGHRAGLRDGDVIVSIGSIPCTARDLDRATSMLEETDGPLEVVVSRGQSRREALAWRAIAFAGHERTVGREVEILIGRGTNLLRGDRAKRAQLRIVCCWLSDDTLEEGEIDSSDPFLLGDAEEGGASGSGAPSTALADARRRSSVTRTQGRVKRAVMEATKVSTSRAVCLPVKNGTEFGLREGSALLREMTYADWGGVRLRVPFPEKLQREFMDPTGDAADESSHRTEGSAVSGGSGASASSAASSAALTEGVVHTAKVGRLLIQVRDDAVKTSTKAGAGVDTSEVVASLVLPLPICPPMPLGPAEGTTWQVLMARPTASGSGLSAAAAVAAAGGIALDVSPKLQIGLGVTVSAPPRKTRGRPGAASAGGAGSGEATGAATGGGGGGSSGGGRGRFETAGSERAPRVLRSVSGWQLHDGDEADAVFAVPGPRGDDASTDTEEAESMSPYTAIALGLFLQAFLRRTSGVLGSAFSDAIRAANVAFRRTDADEAVSGAELAARDVGVADVVVGPVRAKRPSTASSAAGAVGLRTSGTTGSGEKRMSGALPAAGTAAATAAPSDAPDSDDSDGGGRAPRAAPRRARPSASAATAATAAVPAATASIASSSASTSSSSSSSSTVAVVGARAVPSSGLVASEHAASDEEDAGTPRRHAGRRDSDAMEDALDPQDLYLGVWLKIKSCLLLYPRFAEAVRRCLASNPPDTDSVPEGVFDLYQMVVDVHAAMSGIPLLESDKDRGVFLLQPDPLFAPYVPGWVTFRTRQWESAMLPRLRKQDATDFKPIPGKLFTEGPSSLFKVCHDHLKAFKALPRTLQAENLARFAYLLVARPIRQYTDTLGDEVDAMLGLDTSAKSAVKGIPIGKAKAGMTPIMRFFTMEKNDAEVHRAVARLCLLLNNMYYCWQQLYPVLRAVNDLDFVEVDSLKVRPVEVLHPFDEGIIPNELVSEFQSLQSRTAKTDGAASGGLASRRTPGDGAGGAGGGGGAGGSPGKGGAEGDEGEEEGGTESSSPTSGSVRTDSAFIQAALGAQIVRMDSRDSDVDGDEEAFRRAVLAQVESESADGGPLVRMESAEKEWASISAQTKQLKRVLRTGAAAASGGAGAGGGGAGTAARASGALRVMDDAKSSAIHALNVYSVSGTVVRATDLPWMDFYGMARGDPYTITELGNSIEELRLKMSEMSSTRVIRSTSEPVWNERFQLVATGSSPVLRFHVWDWDGGEDDEDDFIGSATVRLQPLLGHGELELILRLADPLSVAAWGVEDLAGEEVGDVVRPFNATLFGTSSTASSLPMPPLPARLAHIAQRRKRGKLQLRLQVQSLDVGGVTVDAIRMRLLQSIEHFCRCLHRNLRALVIRAIDQPDVPEPDKITPEYVNRATAPLINFLNNTLDAIEAGEAETGVELPGLFPALYVHILRLLWQGVCVELLNLLLPTASFDIPSTVPLDPADRRQARVRSKGILFFRSEETLWLTPGQIRLVVLVSVAVRDVVFLNAGLKPRAVRLASEPLSTILRLWRVPTMILKSLVSYLFCRGLEAGPPAAAVNWRHPLSGLSVQQVLSMLRFRAERFKDAEAIEQLEITKSWFK